MSAGAFKLMFRTGFAGSVLVMSRYNPDSFLLVTL